MWRKQILLLLLFWICKWTTRKHLCVTLNACVRVYVTTIANKRKDQWNIIKIDIFFPFSCGVYIRHGIQIKLQLRPYFTTINWKENYRYAEHFHIGCTNRTTAKRTTSIFGKSGGYNQRFVAKKRTKSMQAKHKWWVEIHLYTIFYLFPLCMHESDREWVLLNYLRICTACVQFQPHCIPLIF